MCELRLIELNLTDATKISHVLRMYMNEHPIINLATRSFKFVPTNCTPLKRGKLT